MPPAKLRPSLNEIQNYYHLPLSTAAEKLGICRTLLKKTCRHYKIKRWPFRRLNSLNKKINTLSNSDHISGTINNEDTVQQKTNLQDMIIEKKKIFQDEKVPVTNSRIILPTLKSKIENNGTQILYKVSQQIIKTSMETVDLKIENSLQNTGVKNEVQILPSFSSLMKSIQI
jgi:hypothetical protein